MDFFNLLISDIYLEELYKLRKIYMYFIKFYKGFQKIFV